MVADVSNRLGVGIYTLTEAALFVRARPQTFSRWLFGTKSSRPVVTPDHGEDERLVSFRNLMECLNVRSIRAAGVPMAKIRETIDFVRTAHGIEHPLAHKYPLYRFGDRLIIEIDGDLIETTRPHAGQIQARRIVQPFLQELDFDPKSGEAIVWTPGRSASERSPESCGILFDPQFRFGQPVVEPTRISASVLADAAIAEGSIEAAAEMYGVTTQEVRAAVQYLDSLLVL